MGHLGIRVAIGVTGGLALFALAVSFAHFGLGGLPQLDATFGFLLYLEALVIGVALEEYWWRGRLFDGLLKAVSPWAAVSITSMGFAILHMFGSGRDPYLFPLFFGYGVVLGLCKLITGSLMTTLLAHSLGNALLLVSAIQ